MSYPRLSRRAVAALALAAPFGVACLAAAQVPPEATGAEAAPTTAAATDENRYQHITAQVFVNEQGPFTFIVDTGANRSAIGERLARRLGLIPGAEVEVNTVIGARQRPTVTVDSLRIGEQVQRRVQIPTLGLGDQGADGILGVDWLHNRRLTFHFAERRLTIEPSVGASPLGAIIDGRIPLLLPARLKDGQLTLIDAAVGSQRVTAMIDTGAQFTLGNRALLAWAKSHLDVVRGVSKINIQTVTGEQAEGDLVVMPTMRLGGLRFDAVPVVFSDVQVFKLWNMERQPALVLGLDLIGEFDVMALDFGRRVVRLDPPREVGLADRRRRSAQPAEKTPS